MGIVWRCWYITKPSQAGRILRDALSILERQWQPKGETQHISKTKQERESRSNSSFVSSEETFYHGPPYKYIPVPTYPNLFLSGIDTPSKPFRSALYSYWKGGVRGAFLCGHRAPRTNGLRLFAFNIRSLFQQNRITAPKDKRQKDKRQKDKKTKGQKYKKTRSLFQPNWIPAPTFFSFKKHRKNAVQCHSWGTESTLEQTLKH